MLLAQTILLLGLPPKLHQDISELLRGPDTAPRLIHARDQAELARGLDENPQLIIAYNDGPWGAREALALLERRMLVLPVVVLDPRPSQEAMTELLSLGASDYLGLNQLDGLEAAVVKALHRLTSRQHLLAVSEGRYRTLVETMKDGLMTVDLDAIITFANPALGQMLGYRPDELVGKPLKEMYEEKNWRILQKELEKRKEGISSAYEIKVNTREGDQIPIFISASPLLDDSGAVAGSMAVYTDLSELRRAEASEIRYQTLVETMRDGLIAVDSDAIITFVNPALGKMLGYQREELLGRSVTELYDQENKMVLLRELEKRKHGVSSRYEVKITTKAGGQLPILTSAAPLLGENGTTLGSIAIFTDLSELRQAEAEVHQAAAEWRQCFDSLEDMLVVIDNEYKVQRCNKATKEYLGLAFDEIVGQPCHRLMRNLDAPPDNCIRQRLAETGKVQSEDYQDPKSGRLFAITVSPITDGAGQMLGSVHLYKDVTEQRGREQERVELVMELTRGLEATTMALTNMVDSRDPYTSGHSQRVAELAVKLGTPLGFSEDDLTGLKYCGLLHDIGKGAIPLDILNKPGRLTEHERGIINEHPATAFRILENISFPWPVARVVYEHHERLDGSGYPQGLKGEEIHPWARLLAVCDVVEAMTSHRPYRPAHAMREAFQVLEKGSGNLFDAEVVEAALTSLSIDDRRVTVVDDDAGVLDVYCNFLKRDNYEITSFNDPVEAMEEFAQSPTPILVTDLKMPGKSGLEVLQEAKKVSPDTEVIVITGHGDKDSVVAAMRMGASDFLEKPVQMAELQKAVKRARDRYNKVA